MPGRKSVFRPTPSIMSTSVYAWDSNPAIDPRLFPVSNLRAEQEVRSGISRFVLLPNGRKAIQRVAPAHHDPVVIDCSGERIGKGNLVPFGRVHNPMLAPQKLHYEIPMAGDRTCFARHRRHLIEVSSRNLFSSQKWPMGNTAAAAVDRSHQSA